MLCVPLYTCYSHCALALPAVITCQDKSLPSFEKCIGLHALSFRVSFDYMDMQLQLWGYAWFLA